MFTRSEKYGIGFLVSMFWSALLGIFSLFCFTDKVHSLRGVMTEGRQYAAFILTAVFFVAGLQISKRSGGAFYEGVRLWKPLATAWGFHLAGWLTGSLLLTTMTKPNDVLNDPGLLPFFGLFLTVANIMGNWLLIVGQCIALQDIAKKEEINGGVK